MHDKQEISRKHKAKRVRGARHGLVATSPSTTVRKMCGKWVNRPKIKYEEKYLLPRTTWRKSVSSDGQDGGGSKIRATQEPRELEVIGRELRPRQRNDAKERAVRGDTIIRGYITICTRRAGKLYRAR